MAAAASAIMMVSGRLGMKAATRSPGAMPWAFMAVASRATPRWSSFHDIARRSPFSLRKINAGVSSRRRSKFSVKFRRASGKKRAVGMLSPSTRTRSPRVSAITPAQSHQSVQKTSISSTDQVQSA